MIKNKGIFCRQLSQTGTTFHNMAEVRDEILLLKERLDLCELKNKDFEARLSKMRPTQSNPDFTDQASLEEKLVKMINQQGKDIAQDFLHLQSQV